MFCLQTKLSSCVRVALITECDNVKLYSLFLFPFFFGRLFPEKTIAFIFDISARIALSSHKREKLEL